MNRLLRGFNKIKNEKHLAYWLTGNGKKKGIFKIATTSSGTIVTLLRNMIL